VVPLRAYQRLVSPLLPPTCRFHPTCSTYAIQAVERYGVLRGGWLALQRTSRCHPFNPGGYDPVPDLPRKRRRDSDGHNSTGRDPETSPASEGIKEDTRT